MNSIVRYSVALISGFIAIAPAVASDGTSVVSVLAQPQYWVMGLGTLALVALGMGADVEDIRYDSPSEMDSGYLA